jgi:hypothetical protein
MPDFKRTQKIFEEQGLMKFWKKPLQLLDDELFETKVISPDTKTDAILLSFPSVSILTALG